MLHLQLRSRQWMQLACVKKLESVLKIARAKKIGEQAGVRAGVLKMSLEKKIVAAAEVRAGVLDFEKGMALERKIGQDIGVRAGVLKMSLEQKIGKEMK